MGNGDFDRDGDSESLGAWHEPELLLRPEDIAAAVDKGGVLDESLKEELSRNLVIGVFGNVGGGKSSLINAIFGDAVAETNPIAGWTREVSIYPVKGLPNLRIADTPGLADVSEIISQKGELFAQHTDIFVFVLNAAVGCTDGEKSAFARLTGLKKPLCCAVNKIDTVKPAQRSSFLDATRRQIAAPAAAFFAVAADPLFPEGEAQGMEALVGWIYEQARRQRASPVPVSELETDREAYQEALDSIRREPGMFAYSCVVRVGRLWAVLPHQLSPDEPLLRRLARYGVGLWYAIELPLAALGLAGWIRRRSGTEYSVLSAAYLLLLAGSFTAVHALYWTDLRMRSPLMPGVALAATAGVAWLTGVVERRKSLEMNKLHPSDPPRNLP